MKDLPKRLDDNEKKMEDYRKMDMIVLNLQRACEATIDLNENMEAIKIMDNEKVYFPKNLIKQEQFNINLIFLYRKSDELVIP